MMNLAFFRFPLLLMLLAATLGTACAAGKQLFQPRTLLGGEYWGTRPEEGYLDYLNAVQPDLIHGGVTGPELASCVFGNGKLIGITPIYPGVTSMKEYFAYWRTFNAEAGKRGIKVQSTHSLTYLWGDHEKNTGFFKYYSELWEEDVLGPKPAPAPEAFLRVDAEGKLIRDKYNDWFHYAGCLNNPTWRQLQKAFVKSAVEAGFDGFMVQFPYFDNRCVCQHCQDKFRGFLDANYTKEQLEKEMGIKDLATFKFTIIGSPEGKLPRLDFAARQFGAICVKDCFDDIFVDYGRTLNPDLVVAQWTHFRQFVTEGATNTEFKNYMDERTLLPIERWGQGENYLWYSSPIALYRSDLKNGVRGDSVLDGRVLRAMANGTPFELLKYDYYRWRLITAESLALGGISFGSWKGGWSGGNDREEPHHLQSYYRFIRDNDQYLNAQLRESYAEVALLYARQALFAGDAAFFEPFRNAGRALIDGHILFDVIIDQRMTAAELAKRRAVIVTAPEYLTVEQAGLLKAYARNGGKVIFFTSGPDTSALVSAEQGFEVVKREDRAATMQAIAGLTRLPYSKFAAPWTVEVTADRQPGRVLVHLVNYNRDESQQGKELPIAAAPVAADLRLPAGFKVIGVKFLTPEAPAQHLKFTQAGDRIQFTSPGFLVYGLVMIQGK